MFVSPNGPLLFPSVSLYVCVCVSVCELDGEQAGRQSVSASVAVC